MAGKTVKTTKTTNNEETTSSPDLSKILEMMSSMQEQLASLSKENEELKKQMEENKTEEAVVLEDTVSVGVEVDDKVHNFYLIDNERKIRIYHMQEMLGGTATVINLTNSKRRLKRMGELVTFNIGDFEELVGRYRSFFDRGILAVDAGDIDYAQLYDLPIYDARMKKQYNSKVLKDVVNYNYDQLQEFFKNLSENNKRAFLSFWLGKVYDREEGYYNEEKMRWLNNFSGTETFSSILFEIEQNRSRQRTTTVEVK